MNRALRECLAERIAERCAERAHHLRHLLLHAEAEARARDEIALRWRSERADELALGAWLEVDRLRDELADAEHLDALMWSEIEAGQEARGEQRENRT